MCSRSIAANAPSNSLTARTSNGVTVSLSVSAFFAAASSSSLLTTGNPGGCFWIPSFAPCQSSQGASPWLILANSGSGRGDGHDQFERLGILVERVFQDRHLGFQIDLIQFRTASSASSRGAENGLHLVAAMLAGLILFG